MPATRRQVEESRTVVRKLQLVGQIWQAVFVGSARNGFYIFKWLHDYIIHDIKYLHNTLFLFLGYRSLKYLLSVFWSGSMPVCTHAVVDKLIKEPVWAGQQTWRVGTPALLNNHLLAVGGWMGSEGAKVKGGRVNSASGSVGGVIVNQLIEHYCVRDTAGTLWNGDLCFHGSLQCRLEGSNWGMERADISQDYQTEECHEQRYKGSV